jgi:hypothetical protein
MTLVVWTGVALWLGLSVALVIWPLPRVRSARSVAVPTSGLLPRR